MRRQCRTCGFEHQNPVTRCVRCGAMCDAPPPVVEAPVHNEPIHDEPLWRQLLWGQPERVERWEWGVRVAVLVVMVLWGGYFISLDITPKYAHHLVGSPATSAIGESFMHWINLVFHEAGHLIFMPLGRLMSILGGSLMQLIMPLICLGTFVLKYRNAFGGAVCFWWTGQSMLDLAPYIYDARPRVLTLLGGGNGRELQTLDGGTPHDWFNILTAFGMLQHDQTIAKCTHGLGSTLMVVAMVWGIALMVKQYKIAEPARF